MSFKTITYQTIALAGIAQASHLVHQLATTGRADKEAMQSSLNSLLSLNADNPVDIYGGLAGIKTGLEQLNSQLSSNRISNPDQARYSASLVFLERKFSDNAEMQSKVQNKIKMAQAQSEHFGSNHENVIANLADIYHTTISTFNPRIMVNGDQAYLSAPDVINKIRALLLAGIRSAMLWRQCGGSRWRFIFYRRKTQKEAEFLLSEIEKLA
ncbi:high frequency lysogenization protein [Bathymodiolus platifrons methanotrophic gill symbiont]|nr:high frequency lysogenization protein HflD [Bathymodiolus platifrons methanotrophic gill symbiont]MCK5870915.1 high frequency lysogenization protein HflD [Methyloprofundus sp.]TXL10903.1 lysogenization regulator HflD [Methylococcaceae bacterium CS2]GAW86726.1 high frequency lysogenization protein [Bathymodiolus platifrons methanotrophic gill symbiont]GFO73835.1 high frequency lysogenization protein [Bathymodiolus platifrons methanotrophic gill symbiont]